MLRTLVNGFVYFTAGVVTLAIGSTLSISASLHYTHSAMGIFEVMKYVSIIGLLVLGLWIMAIYEELDRERD
jgi:hypothetical protein